MKCQRRLRYDDNKQLLSSFDCSSISIVNYNHGMIDSHEYRHHLAHKK